MPLSDLFGFSTPMITRLYRRPNLETSRIDHHGGLPDSRYLPRVGFSGGRRAPISTWCPLGTLRETVELSLSAVILS
jgi:hypothetical protein